MPPCVRLGSAGGDLRQLRDGLRLQAARQRGEVDALGEALAVGQQEVEPALLGQDLAGVGLGRVQDDPRRARDRVGVGARRR